MTALNATRAAQGPAPGKGGASSAEMQKLQEKLEQVQEDYAEEKRQAVKLEEHFYQQKTKLEKNDEQLKQHIKSMALTEMENDELKNDVRQMGYMVEDLEQKLDS